MPNSTKKNPSGNQERRYIKSEIRLKGDSAGKQTIVGYASKFPPAISHNLGGFREQIDPHAFDDCLSSNPDIVALFNHDVNLVLGRTTSGTLRVSADKIGLRYEVVPPDNAVGNNLLVSLRRGDISQASFGMVVLDDKWEEASDGTVIRTVLKANVFDVSPVTFGAYPDATSGLRASLRTCPLSLRSKIKRSDDAVDNDNDFDCDNADADEDDSDCESRCDCTCTSCEQGNCDDCSDPDCDDDDCQACPAQERAAHRQLLMRRMRS